MNNFKITSAKLLGLTLSNATNISNNNDVGILSSWRPTYADLDNVDYFTLRANPSTEIVTTNQEGTSQYLFSIVFINL